MSDNEAFQYVCDENNIQNLWIFDSLANSETHKFVQKNDFSLDLSLDFLNRYEPHEYKVNVTIEEGIFVFDIITISDKDDYYDLCFLSIFYYFKHEYGESVTSMFARNDMNTIQYIKQIRKMDIDSLYCLFGV